MIVTDKFVFVHLPRSGGTFVSDVIRKCFPAAREIGYHLPRLLLPKEFSHLPVLGTVRNPWEYYVSWFHHQHAKQKHGPLFSFVTENQTLDFVGTTQNELNLCINENLDVLLQALPENFNYQERNIPNLTRDVMCKIRGTGSGLYSFRFNQMFGPGDGVYFCRVESLRNDLIEFFESIGVASASLHSCILGLGNKNISAHAHYSTYYTADLAELVSIRDRQLIERFGYVFERASESKMMTKAASTKPHGSS